jgi:hypothetical protein
VYIVTENYTVHLTLDRSSRKETHLVRVSQFVLEPTEDVCKKLLVEIVVPYVRFGMFEPTLNLGSGRLAKAGVFGSRIWNTSLIMLNSHGALPWPI